VRPFVSKTAAWLHRRAEDVMAALLGVMFVAFLLQIVFRYFFSFPVGWTSELTVAAWLWLVLWGSAFVLTEKEEIRFDLVYSALVPALAASWHSSRASCSWRCMACRCPPRGATSRS
jgi:TRAP-type C4-dicarboxylate transport system permease small subunit